MDDLLRESVLILDSRPPQSHATWIRDKTRNFIEDEIDARFHSAERECHH
jgi:hypothetical protein